MFSSLSSLSNVDTDADSKSELKSSLSSSVPATRDSDSKSETHSSSSSSSARIIQIDPDDDLHLAIKNGNQELLEKAIENYRENNQDLSRCRLDFESSNVTLLSFAVAQDKTSIVKYLLTLADVKKTLNEVADDAWTTLAYAAQHLKPEMIKLLIQAGANVNASKGLALFEAIRNMLSLTPSQWDRSPQKREIIECLNLLSRGFDFDTNTNEHNCDLPWENGFTENVPLTLRQIMDSLPQVYRDSGYVGMIIRQAIPEIASSPNPRPATTTSHSHDGRLFSTSSSSAVNTSNSSTAKKAI